LIDVIYLAGGKGIRVGLGYPKQFARIGGKPIIIYGLETLNKIDEIGNIIIPCEADYVDTIDTYKDIYNITKNIELVQPGRTRQESVYNGLQNINTEYVLICEAVRPFMSVDLVNKVINSNNDVVCPISSPVATVVMYDKYRNVYTLDRDNCGQVQMPQKFKTDILFECHKAAIESKNTHTDDLALVLINSIMTKYKSIEDINIIKGEEENIKITTPLDLHIAEAILKYKAGDKIE
jgi:2-C-methyl-D-erythritol 4-phosphate cytidylyltransferase